MFSFVSGSRISVKKKTDCVIISQNQLKRIDYVKYIDYDYNIQKILL